ncbi:hypothetical protein [Pseudofrankia asymbiotica]|uniref:Uncharacterized protein n=1 Tax=Pseudofrankia asymbiotica TaxID=1834516 RepID=A0A1V2I0U6_9ACTN|nr:hypothetical protein [Pseudofrankia asymbiotica]ONH22561.1 hypothetical protein BL253_35335 [Pseudofrankia asymbiotica]
MPAIVPRRDMPAHRQARHPDCAAAMNQGPPADGVNEPDGSPTSAAHVAGDTSEEQLADKGSTADGVDIAECAGSAGGTAGAAASISDQSDGGQQTPAAPRIVVPADPPVLTAEAARVLLRILVKASAARNPRAPE